MKELLRAALAEYIPQELDADLPAARAAVLILLYEHNGEIRVIFQKRTDSVRDHKGQISFPGGGADPGDTSLLYTALRETHEEIGVRPEDIDILGRIDEMSTISNFRITPFVGWLAYYPYTWHFSDDEVAYLLEIPLRHLLDPATLIPDRRFINGRTYELPSYQFENDLVWGATARMLTNFLDVCASVPGFRPTSRGLGNVAAG
ncbi:MAG: CoA pyrophosphatase [Tepidiformaceae bacterium]